MPIENTFFRENFVRYCLFTYHRHVISWAPLIPDWRYTLLHMTLRSYRRAPARRLKGLTQLWKSRRICPKYMPKCSVGSTDHVCKFYPKILRNVEDIDVWNSAKKGLCYVICGSEVKTSVLAAHFSRNSGPANTILFTIQTFNEHSRMAKLSQLYLRGHMRWNVTSQQVLC